MKVPFVNLTKHQGELKAKGMLGPLKVAIFSIEVLHHHVTRVATVTRPPCWMACTCKTHYDLTRHGEVLLCF